jgi:nitric oxide dioxygenase
LFAERPELLRVFNVANQATGEQSRALVASVVAYAVQLIDPAAPAFGHVMNRIADKHVSLGIRPEQYTIVGRHLLAAVGDVLGAAVTPAVAQAWDEVYWLFATQLIAEEARLYATGDRPQGPRHERSTGGARIVLPPRPRGSGGPRRCQRPGW